MTTKGFDIIQKPFDPNYAKEWEGTTFKHEIFLQMYIMEKYKDVLFYVPFNELEVVYDKQGPSIYMHIFNYSKNKGDIVYYKNKNFLVDDFNTIMLKYINKYRKTKKRFSYYNISIRERNDKNSHAITVLYDKKTNEIEFFQRNPSNEKYSVFEHSKIILVNFFRYVYGENIKPVLNNNLCLKAYWISNLCSTMHFELYQGIDGDCLIWSLWYLELRLRNFKISRSQALNKTINIFKKDLKLYNPNVNIACKVILGYRTFIDNFTKQFYWVKTSKGQAIRIDKKKVTPLLKKAERLMKLYLFYTKNYLDYNKIEK